MKTDPRYGYFPWWPEDGDAWIHPEDIARARQLIPSWRIWRRDGVSGPFVVLHYGDVRIRVRPTMWKEVAGEGLEVGDWVEVLSRMGLNRYRIGRIRAMCWDDHGRSIHYQVEDRQQPVPSWFRREDLRRVDPVSEPPSSGGSDNPRGD